MIIILNFQTNWIFLGFFWCDSLWGTTRQNISCFFFSLKILSFLHFYAKNVDFTLNFENRDEKRIRHEKREVQNCREPGKSRSRETLIYFDHKLFSCMGPFFRILK